MLLEKVTTNNKMMLNAFGHNENVSKIFTLLLRTPRIYPLGGSVETTLRTTRLSTPQISLCNIKYLV